MNKNSIPAFIENLAVDTENAKYSRAKLKMYYIGQTADKRLFTQEFSDKILSTIAYTPVVGYYSVADEDFVGHNNVQHIYGIVPESAQVEYQTDEASGNTFAVTDILLYTGREDEIGTVASKIVGKQHSLELDPKTVAYKVNYDDAGNFKNLEFTDGELVGLSVLGDNERPAFTGSEFFSAVELPNFITEENQGKYEALFNSLVNIEPTAEEAKNEIYSVLEAQNVYGYICEHKVDKYVVIEEGYGRYNRYSLSRDEQNALTATLDCSVRPRFVSDEEIGAIENKAKAIDFTDGSSQKAGEQTPAGQSPEDNSAAAFANNDNILPEGHTAIPTEELETLRSNYENLQAQLNELSTSSAAVTESFNTLTDQYKNYIVDSYGDILEQRILDEAHNNISSYSIEELIQYMDTQAKEITAHVEDPITIMDINDNNNSYDEFSEEDVVKKYSQIKRGNN